MKVGDIVKFGNSSTTAGDIYYLNPSGQWTQARANAVPAQAGRASSGAGAARARPAVCARPGRRAVAKRVAVWCAAALQPAGAAERHD